MNVFVAGICGTFMAGIAQLAREMGHRVSGCDANVYPPMSDVLANAGIEVREGYNPAHIDPDTDQIVIGNALSRGNPLVEAVLNRGLTYRSGPAWLAEHVLPNYRVIAVAGTHGKTSTSSMIAWILEQTGRHPGFLIGGKPGNFDVTARLGSGRDFVIEADEYDTAFFDKRSKFVHYGPRIAVLNNLEFDHADIFDDLGQIQRQFHHLIRIVPGEGVVIVNDDDGNLGEVLEQGLWSQRTGFSLDHVNADWHARPLSPAAGDFEIFRHGDPAGTVHWSCLGVHNMQNALAAIAATYQAGVESEAACEALEHYQPNARRLQRLYESERTTLYEDFAHHPTAIRRTLETLRSHAPDARLIAIIEPRSNTMRLGHDSGMMAEAFQAADEVILFRSSSLSWDPDSLADPVRLTICDEPEDVIATALDKAADGAQIVAMSNGSFAGIPADLARELNATT